MNLEKKKFYQFIRRKKKFKKIQQKFWRRQYLESSGFVRNFFYFSEKKSEKKILRNFSRKKYFQKNSQKAYFKNPDFKISFYRIFSGFLILRVSNSKPEKEVPFETLGDLKVCSHINYFL